MKKYESVFILDTLKVDDDGKAFSNELAKIVAGLGGEMLESIPMGRKQFAREIKKRKGGVYWNFIFNLDPDQVKPLCDKFKLDERVIRVMVVIYDQPDTPEKNNAPEEAAENDG